MRILSIFRELGSTIPAIVLGGFLLAREGGAFPFVNAQPASATTETLTTTDIEVIEATATHSEPSHASSDHAAKVTYLAIVMECDAGEIKSGCFLPTGLVDIPSTQTVLLDLRERNARAFRLREPIPRGSILIIGNRTPDRLFQEKTIEKRFPDARDCRYFWLPGYDKKGTKAAVYYWWPGFGDGLSGSGWMVYLERRDGVWKKVRMELAWQS